MADNLKELERANISKVRGQKAASLRANGKELKDYIAAQGEAETAKMTGGWAGYEDSPTTVKEADSQLRSQAQFRGELNKAIGSKNKVDSSKAIKKYNLKTK